MNNNVETKNLIRVKNPLLVFALILVAGDGPLTTLYTLSTNTIQSWVLLISLIIFIFGMSVIFCIIVIKTPRNLYSPDEIPEAAIGNNIYPGEHLHIDEKNKEKNVNENNDEFDEINFTRIFCSILTKSPVKWDTILDNMTKYFNKIDINIYDYVIMQDQMNNENKFTFSTRVIIILSKYIKYEERENHIKKALKIDNLTFKIQNISSNLIVHEYIK
jgi:hypothetical protein